MVLLGIVVLLTCNTLDRRQSLLQRHLIQQMEAGDGYRWLYQSDTLSIRALAEVVQGEVLFSHLAIMLHDSAVYANTTDRFSSQFDLLPIVRHLANCQHEVLMGIVPQADQYRILQLILNDTALVRTDTLPLFDGQHLNADRDAAIEFKGYWSNPLPYCLDCDSTYYNPQLFYEMSDTGFVLDAAATQNWASKHLGGFYGFRPDTLRVVPWVGEYE